MINKIKCFLGLHKLYIVRRLFYMTDLIGCKHCTKYWGMNHDVRAFLPFDLEMYEMYRSFGLRGLRKYITK